MKSIVLAGFVGLILMAGSVTVSASDVGRFHTAVADANDHYRQAVFYLRTENPAVAAIELDDFIAKWDAVIETFDAAPPDVYADDPAWSATLAEIGARAREGLAALDQGNASTAREVVGPVRGQLGDLRRRNGVTTFSDRIDELTAVMDVLARYRREVTDIRDDAVIEPVRNQAAVVEYVFEKVRRNAPPMIAQDPEFKRMYEGVAESMGRLWRGLEMRDLRLFRIGSGELRSHERLLYLRFG